MRFVPVEIKRKPRAHMSVEIVHRRKAVEQDQNMQLSGNQPKIETIGVHRGGG